VGLIGVVSLELDVSWARLPKAEYRPGRKCQAEGDQGGTGTPWLHYGHIFACNRGDAGRCDSSTGRFL